MTTECTAVFQNDLFQGNQDLSSAAMHDAAVAAASDECAQRALFDPSQGYARKAAARIRAGLHQSGAVVSAGMPTPFDVPIGCTAGTRIEPSLGPLLFPTAQVHTDVLTSDHDRHIPFFSPAQAAVSFPNPFDSSGSNVTGMHEAPVLSRLTNALQLAFRINSNLLPEELAAPLVPIQQYLTRTRSLDSFSVSSTSGPATEWTVPSKFASAKYVPSVHAHYGGRAYPGASGRHVSAVSASNSIGSARWAVAGPIPTFNRASDSKSFASHDAARLSSSTDVPDLGNVGKLLQGPLPPQTLAQWRGSFAKASLALLSEKQPATSLIGTLRARRIAIEAAECMQLMEASDFGRNALTTVTDDPAYLKKLRASVQEEETIPQGYSFGIFPPSWPPRRAVYAIVENSRFENFMFLCIAVSCAISPSLTLRFRNVCVLPFAAICLQHKVQISSDRCIQVPSWCMSILV